MILRESYVVMRDCLPWFTTPVGWTMMAYEKRGKPVCRYFTQQERHDG